MTKAEKIRNHPKYSTLAAYFALRSERKMGSAESYKTFLELLHILMIEVAGETRTTPMDVRNALRSVTGKRGRPKFLKCPYCGSERPEGRNARYVRTLAKRPELGTEVQPTLCVDLVVKGD